MLYLISIGCNENIIFDKEPVQAQDSGSPDEVSDEPPVDTSEPAPLPLPTELIYVHTQTQLYSLSGEGEFNGNGTFSLADGSTPYITDIAINSAGEFFAVSTSSLFQVNPETADLTLIGLLSEPLFGLGFDVNGTLYGTGEGLFIVSPENASLVSIQLDRPLTNTGDLIGFPDGNLLCFMDNPEPADGDVLIAIQPQTGSTEAIHTTQEPQFWGAAFTMNSLFALSNSGVLLVLDFETGGSQLYETEVTDVWGASENPLVQN